MDVRDDSSSSSRGVLPTGTRKTSLPTVALAGTSSYSPLSSGVDRSPATFTTTQRSMTRRGRSTLTPAGSERAPYAAQPVAMRRSPARRPTLRCRPRRRGLSPSLPGADRVSSAISRSTSSSPASRAGSTAFQRRTRPRLFRPRAPPSRQGGRKWGWPREGSKRPANRHLLRPGMCAGACGSGLFQRRNGSEWSRQMARGLRECSSRSLGLAGGDRPPRPRTTLRWARTPVNGRKLQGRPRRGEPR